MGIAEDNARDYRFKRKLDDARRSLLALLEGDEAERLWSGSQVESVQALITALRQESDRIVRRWN